MEEPVHVKVIPKAFFSVRKSHDPHRERIARVSSRSMTVTNESHSLTNRGSSLASVCNSPLAVITVGLSC